MKGRDLFFLSPVIPGEMPRGFIIGSAAAGFKDSSLWEEAEKKGEAAVKRLIDKGLEGTSVTVVCVGYRPAGRKYINYEIDESMKRGNGIVAVQIHHLEDSSRKTDPPGEIPYKITANGYKAYKYVNHDLLAKWIEEAATAAGR